jgi:L-asparaginase
LADLIRACAGTGLRGMVLQSYGEGNFPSGNPDDAAKGAVYRALQAATDAGMILVDSTQVIAGTVNYSAYAAGAWLPIVGALSAADMTPVAALAKLSILLAASGHAGWSTETVKMLFRRNLRGEMLSLNLLDSRDNAVLLPGQALVALDASAQLLNDPDAGPRLVASSGEILWSPGVGPGRLVMRTDGELALYDGQMALIWQAGSGRPDGAASALLLSGSAEHGTLTLTVRDYANGQTVATLYSR